MATKSTIQLRGSFESEPSGSRSIGPADLVNLDAPADVTSISLLSGDNVITIPSKARGAVIVFDSRSTTNKKIKGDPTDVGISIFGTGWMVLGFDGSVTFIINSDANDNDGGGTPVPFYTEVTFF